MTVTATALPPTINEQIIEALYTEALVLAEEARAAFDLRAEERYASAPDAARVALSIEGLRTTTRLMNVLAWLLNQRAYLSGEMSASQLKHHGTLGAERASDPVQMMELEPETRALIRETERLYARVARLDADWRAGDAPSPVRDLQGRITRAFRTH